MRVYFINEDGTWGGGSAERATCPPDATTVKPPELGAIWKDGKWEIDQTKLRKNAIDAIQSILDAKAQELGFDSIHTSGMWRDSSNPDRKARAQALFLWGDAVWDFAEAEWERQAAGTPTYTTIDDFLAALPVFVM